MALLSLLKALYYFMTGRMKFPDRYTGSEIRMDDGLTFKIIRHMKLARNHRVQPGALFIVRFRFRKFGHEKNIMLSRIPIPLIAGFPGFRDKVWMIDYETGFWQGVYQWDSVGAAEKYKKSFVLGLMNRRAVGDSLRYETLSHRNLDEYLAEKTCSTM